jgi:coenzyme PQQ precursor peptide PqqA
MQRPDHHFIEERMEMTWETPIASDYRFDFEITMYIAAR